MKLLLFITLMVLSGASYASHIEHCALSVEIKNRVYYPAQLGSYYVKSYVALVKETEMLESSYVDCKDYVGKLLIVDEIKGGDVTIGQSIRLKYYLTDSRSHGTKVSFTIIDSKDNKTLESTHEEA